MPDISRETLTQYYQQDYGSSNRGDRQVEPERYFREQLASNSPAFKRYTTRAQRQIDLLKKHGAALEKVLDYGSGPGYFLHACKAPQASAVEPDELSHKYLTYLGATIHSDFRSLPKAEFDTIVASHSIEHVPAADLHETLTALISALKPQGRLLIEVPQGGHSYLHLAGHRQDPHTLFFTGQALVEALKAAGAEILFQQAMSRVDSPRRIDPIYTGTGDPFFETARGSLTVICRP
ncbi:class I SAM-dependent methyltransferase [Pseudorhodobacter turbinis]|uniref:class I SAM-dependent methyltransferase n=1 Tax=Pseudorhodobacter turbinis TaxID=2500533 RepID=UPI00143D3638|nr:class I SAM-dependent methyltransferase [Pseudorhodobacter turbinis]